MLENVHLGEALEARKAGSLASGIGSLARAALPFAFATAAQAIVVIAGGIDLGRSRQHH